MNKSTTASLAIASLLSLGVAADAQAAKDKKEKTCSIYDAWQVFSNGQKRGI